MRRLMRTLQIYLSTMFSWATAWRVAGDEPPQVDAPVRTVKHDDGFDYVEIEPRPE